MKLPICLLAVSIIALSCSRYACTKSDTSTLGLLTAKRWLLDSVYSDYAGDGTGTLIYARGSNNNAVDLDKSRAVLWRDGEEDNFTNTGVYLPLKWSFVNGDSTELYTPPYPVYVPKGIYARIIRLSVNHLALFDKTNHALDVFVYKP